MNRYSTEEKQQAIDLYFKNGCNMKKTVRELGYGSATGILRWLRETVPDKVSKPVQRNWKVDYPEEIKQAAVIDLCENNTSPADIAEKYGISRATLYEWKVQYIGKGNCFAGDRHFFYQVQESVRTPPLRCGLFLFF